MCTDERIVVLAGDGDQGTWTPTVGDETRAVLERTGLDGPNRRAVTQTSVRILSHCADPNTNTGSRTGLVVGYVQSGKTLSFTTVAALANDNGFQLIVVIAGMTKDLSRQSHARLLRDLGVEESPFSRWADFFEPSLDDVGRLRDVLAEAQDPTIPERDRRTVLVTLKKNHDRLRNLVDVLDRLGDALRVPALVIDDEADQASLNNLVRRGDLSTTYRRIRELRDLLPAHTFLQYTATPQAPILINLLDVLSPDFPIVLDPGPDYTGGREFFTGETPYIADIPPAEIHTTEQPLTAPPRSLMRALQLFFIGVASGRLRRDNAPLNRSMMVHPARQTERHQQYFNWVRSIRNRWMQTLQLPADDPDRRHLQEEFQAAYADISRTVEDLEMFDAIAEVLLAAIRTTDVRLVNSLAEANRQIHWGRNYSWILIGGQVLDRGFTVEGLTVTYMPRGPGVGNADTIQQRARFLGYKRRYLGYCRVFLETGVAELYRRYVSHEEDVRRRLVQHIATGRPLSTFRRLFLLDREFRPTRQSVIDIDYTRPRFRGGWCVPNRPHEADVDANQTVVQTFVERFAHLFASDEGHANRLEHHRHRVARALSLDIVYSELLTSLQTKDIEDSQRWTAALMLIDRYLTTVPEAGCVVYQMRPGQRTWRQVRDGRIVYLFQGAYPKRDVYPGDQGLRDAPVTIQLHVVSLRAGNRADSPVVAENVTVPVIWMAPDVWSDVVAQPQGGDD